MSVILYEVGTANPQQLEFDVSEQETISLENKVTEHPVEHGSNIADNVRVELDSVKIKGVLADYPLGTGGDTFPPVDATSGKNSRGQQLLKRLVAWRDSAQLLSVSAPLWYQENAIVQHLEIENNARSGDLIRFTITLKEIRFVQTQTVAVKIPKAKKDLGPKATTDKPVAKISPGALQKLQASGQISMWGGAWGSVFAAGYIGGTGFAGNPSIAPGMHITGVPDDAPDKQKFDALQALIAKLPPNPGS